MNAAVKRSHSCCMSPNSRTSGVGEDAPQRTQDLYAASIYLAVWFFKSNCHLSDYACSARYISKRGNIIMG